MDTPATTSDTRLSFSANSSGERSCNGTGWSAAVRTRHGPAPPPAPPPPPAPDLHGAIDALADGVVEGLDVRGGQVAPGPAAPRRPQPQPVGVPAALRHAGTAPPPPRAASREAGAGARGAGPRGGLAALRRRQGALRHPPPRAEGGAPAHSCPAAAPRAASLRIRAAPGLGSTATPVLSLTLTLTPQPPTAVSPLSCPPQPCPPVPAPRPVPHSHPQLSPVPTPHPVSHCHPPFSPFPAPHSHPPPCFLHPTATSQLCPWAVLSPSRYSQHHVPSHLHPYHPGPALPTPQPCAPQGLCSSSGEALMPPITCYCLRTPGPPNSPPTPTGAGTALGGSQPLPLMSSSACGAEPVYGVPHGKGGNTHDRCPQEGFLGDLPRQGPAAPRKHRRLWGLHVLMMV